MIEKEDKPKTYYLYELWDAGNNGRLVISTEEPICYVLRKTTAKSFEEAKMHFASTAKQ